MTEAQIRSFLSGLATNLVMVGATPRQVKDVLGQMMEDQTFWDAMDIVAKSDVPKSLANIETDGVRA